MSSSHPSLGSSTEKSDSTSSQKSIREGDDREKRTRVASREGKQMSDRRGEIAPYNLQLQAQSQCMEIMHTTCDPNEPCHLLSITRACMHQCFNDHIDLFASLLYDVIALFHIWLHSECREGTSEASRLPRTTISSRRRRPTSLQGLIQCSCL